MDPLTNLLGVQAAQMTETFLLRELQTSGIAKPLDKNCWGLTRCLPATLCRISAGPRSGLPSAISRIQSELREGLETAYEQGYDTDEFDAFATTSSSSTPGPISSWGRIACKLELPPRQTWLL